MSGLVLDARHTMWANKYGTFPHQASCSTVGARGRYMTPRNKIHRKQSVIIEIVKCYEGKCKDMIRDFRTLAWFIWDAVGVGEKKRWHLRRNLRMSRREIVKWATWGKALRCEKVCHDSRTDRKVWLELRKVKWFWMRLESLTCVRLGGTL